MSAPFRAQSYQRVVLLQTAAEWAETTDKVLQDYETGRESDTGLEKTGDGTSTWADLSYDSPLPFAAEAGSIPFADGNGLSEDNVGLYYDSTSGTLKLLESGYDVAASGWNQSSKAGLQIGNNNTPHVFGSDPGFYGAKIDVYTSQSSGSFKQTSGIRVRASNAATGGNYITTAVEAFVSNANATANSVAATLLQGHEAIVQVSQDISGSAAGAVAFDSYCNVSNGATATNLWGLRAFVYDGTTTTVTNAIGVLSKIQGNGGTMTNAYGINLSGWSGSNITNSYGIYMDTTIDRGTSLKYAIYSLSTSPSLLTGELVLGNKLTMTEIAAPSAPAANGGVLYLQDNGAGKTQLMVRFATGAAQQVAIEP